MQFVEIVRHIGFFSNVGVDAGRLLVLALHFGELSVLGSNLHHAHLAGDSHLLSARVVVHLASLHPVGFILVTLPLLLDLFGLDRVEAKPFIVELLGKSCFLLLVAQNLHKSLFANHLQ